MLPDSMSSGRRPYWCAKASICSIPSANSRGVTKDANQPSLTRATRFSAAALRPPTQMSIFCRGRGVMVTCSNR